MPYFFPPCPLTIVPIIMKSYFDRNPYRQLPDGRTMRLFPFHICLEGLESRVLCRDDSDYDVFVKIICLAVHRKEAVLVIYTVVSNHMHCLILASDIDTADSCVDEIKKLYSMYFNRKYQEFKVLKRNDAKAIFLDSDYYVRNAIAYSIRNALDNGAKNVQDYKWTGFKAAFCDGRCSSGKRVRPVSALTKNERRTIFHTGDKLDDVGWLIDDEDRLEPVSICDWRYIESAFNNDQGFFLRLIGGVNISEMNNKLLVAPRSRRSDNELLLSVNEIAQRWFAANVNELPVEKKARLLIYVYRSFKTTPAQLARVLEIKSDTVRQLLGQKH